MIEASDISVLFSSKKLFDGVNVKFTDGNCYGIIGANGSGKSTFLKILSGELEPSTGSVIKPKGQRLAVLKQDQFAYDDYEVLQTVFMGHNELYGCMEEKEKLYAKDENDFTEEDGIRLGDLEGIFSELGGWEAESEAATLLNGLGIHDELQKKKMAELENSQKVKILLAQSLFGSPDILLLDEPTNNLDIKAINWLENFLLHYEKTVIVVSHDRHFLNKVCTHIADIDFQKIQLYAGNYDFWKESSELALKLKTEANKKNEEKAKELQNFIARFSSNASKAKQATSRKKLLEKITIDDIRPSSRKYPYIVFKPNRDAGQDMLTVEGLSKVIDGKVLFQNLTMKVKPGEKIAFVGHNDQAKTVLFQILMGELKADAGQFKWGSTTSRSFLPKDNNRYFESNKLNLVDWLRQYSKDKNEEFIRGFLGRMLFSGDNALKEVHVLSGGEKMRCMYSKVMLEGPNVLFVDGPTEHLDLESITSVNTALKDFTGNLFMSTHDHSLIQSVCTRMIELTPRDIMDKEMSYDQYLEDKNIQSKLEEMYKS